MKKKLIEVALPLEAINKESAREKSIRHGHPSTLHLWWARRPLAACRAVLFASLVDDPGSRPDLFPTEAEQHAERQRLFDLISELVKWENSNNSPLLKQAKEAIWRSAGPDGPPPVYDPFCGGGSIPHEAQRLGLEAHGSDLSPVAVLITKALIEIPPQFSNQPPINPDAVSRTSKPQMWTGSTGLAEDVRYYGNWLRDEAEVRVGHLYPPHRLEHGQNATILAWLWARTVKCQNPACGATIPLVRGFSLSTKKGREHWVNPAIENETGRLTFRVAKVPGVPPPSTKVGRGAKFKCLSCAEVSGDHYIRAEAMAGRMSVQLMAVAIDGPEGRTYADPDAEHHCLVASPEVGWAPDAEMSTNPRWFSPPAFGLTRFRDLFTNRQLVTLSAFADLVSEVRVRMIVDGASKERADAIVGYLAMCVSKLSVFTNVIARWRAGENKSAPAFGRQAIPMVWDFVEINPFAGAGGDFGGIVNACVKVLSMSTVNSPGFVVRAKASELSSYAVQRNPIISTDPPYYDNISYAELADFFYVWLRRMLQSQHPDLFETILASKEDELVASTFRAGGDKEEASKTFEAGFACAFQRFRTTTHPDYPMTVYYAFKQTELDEEGDSSEDQAVASTGWETMLEGMLRSGFQVVGTWPLKTEGATRLISMGTNALASSIVLVCRPRPESAAITTRKAFLTTMKRDLPAALRALQQGNIAPVDLAQAAIGPGMAVFSSYSKVLENDGSEMSVRTALQLINQILDEVLSEQESDFDPDTRFALTWFEQRGFDEGPYGDAETLATARAISVDGLTKSGIASSRAGKVKLIARKDLSPNWDPSADERLTVWESTQYLIRALEEKGEAGAAALAAKLGAMGETARELAYRLYTLCERKGWTEEAIAYNALVVSWPAISQQAKEAARGQEAFSLTSE